MIADRISLILDELQVGTGAGFAGTVQQKGLRRGLKVWFAELDERHGPYAELVPFGLRGHLVRLGFGNFSAAVIAQMKQAPDEDVQLAHALVASIHDGVALEIAGQDREGWNITDGGFQISATVRNLEEPDSDHSLTVTCREVIVPLMAAMAELIGYDAIEVPEESAEKTLEGTILRSVVERRERNPRNRLLCIRIHGERCSACDLEPRLKYGVAGGIIEVHHLQPLSTLGEARAYDPRTDLVPLCPSCHRAVHTRRPLPYSPAELRQLMGAGQ